MIRFCLALGSVSFWPRLPEPLWLLLPFTLLLLALAWRPCRISWPLWLGLLWGMCGGYLLEQRLLPIAFEGRDLRAQGVVVGLSRRQQSLCRFDLQLDQLIGASAGQLSTSVSAEATATALSFKAPSKLRLSWYDCNRLPQPGERWQFSLRLKRPSGFYNPGGFDYPLYLLSRGFMASGYVREAEPLDGAAPLVGRIDSIRTRLAGWLDHRIETKTTDQAIATALLKALLLGDRRGLEPKHWQLLRDSGTAHLVVVSGLHIGLLAGFCYGSVLLIGRLLPFVSYRKRQVAAALLAILGSGGYALLAGFELPSQRAWIMVSVVLLSLIGLRAVSTHYRLLLALTVVLLIDPLAPRQSSLWLSFGACGILVWAFAGQPKGWRWWRSLLWAQLAIALGLTPWLLFLFYQWSPLAPMINLLAVPIVGLMLPLALMGALLCLWSPAIGLLLLELVLWVLRQGWSLLAWLQEPSWILQLQSSLSHSLLLVGVLAAMLALLPRAVPGRWSLAGLMMLPLLLALFRPHHSRIV